MNSACGAVGYFLSMTGKQNVFRTLTVLAIVLNVTLNFPMIRPFGITGAAAASMVTLTLWNLADVIYVRRVFGIRMFYVPGSRG